MVSLFISPSTADTNLCGCKLIDMPTWLIILLSVAGLAFAFFVIRGLHRGWREENEPDPGPDPTKMPIKDDIERADKQKRMRA